jgi:uncharacterized protein YbaA (DUF1428 family)
MARLGGKIWKEHGALEYRECVLDDPRSPMKSFPAVVRAKRGDVVVFSWIVFRSKAHRDRVNARVMKDSRLEAFANRPMPFDVRRMAYGGFKILVDL